MKTIVCFSDKFTYLQDVVVLEDNKVIHEYETDHNALPQLLFNVAKQYDVNTIRFIGMSFFIEDIQQQISEMEQKEYGTSNIVLVKG